MSTNEEWNHSDLTILTNLLTVAATEADVKAKEMKKALAESKFKSQHLWAKEPTKEQVMKRIAQWSDKIKKMEVNIKHKDDNKEVSLGTSKVCLSALCLNQSCLTGTEADHYCDFSSTTWILEYQSPGAKETRCRSRRSSRRHCAINSIGPWPCLRHGNSMRRSRSKVEGITRGKMKKAT